MTNQVMKLEFVVCPTPAVGCQYSLTGFMNYQLSNTLFVLSVLSLLVVHCHSDFILFRYLFCFADWSVLKSDEPPVESTPLSMIELHHLLEACKKVNLLSFSFFFLNIFPWSNSTMTGPT